VPRLRNFWRSAGELPFPGQMPELADVDAGNIPEE